METTVSVVITTFNKAQYLEQAIRSVLSQTFPHVECIIVDDGSTDHTQQVIKTLIPDCPTIQYFYKPNGGVSSARNFGAEKASGEWIQFLDADDWLHPDKIRFQLSCLPSVQQTAVIYSDYERVFFNRNEQLVRTQIQTIGLLTKAQLVERLLVCPDFLANSPFPLLQQAMLFKKNLLDEKTFDPWLKACEDREFVLELLLQNIPFIYAPTIGAYYRKHSFNLTDNNSLMRESYVKYFEIVCNRHAELIPLCQLSVQFLLEKSLEERDGSNVARLASLAQFPVELLNGKVKVFNRFWLQLVYRLRCIFPSFLFYERYRGPRSRKVLSILASMLKVSKATRSDSVNS